MKLIYYVWECSIRYILKEQLRSIFLSDAQYSLQISLHIVDIIKSLIKINTQLRFINCSTF